ncbi:MAG: transposase, partial [Candidatus Atribacteria bacterium]|nr:transposase [Candidatus Atribacteria bacterium]
MILSEGMETVLSSFRHLFTTPTWGDVQILLIGAILCRGKRTVTAVLRTMGLKHEPHFTNFHRVLNRNRWSPLSASRLRFHLLLDLLPSSQS